MRIVALHLLHGREGKRRRRISDAKQIGTDVGGYLLGPLTLAADSRTGKPADSVFAPTYNATLCADHEIIDGVSCVVKLEFAAEDGEKFYLVDYASSGRDWETVIAAGLPTK